MQRQQERGQAIVLVVLALVALLALVGLAVDGGRQYTARRQAQNAADSASLAGTHKLAQKIGVCPPNNSITDADVTQAVIAMVRANGLNPILPGSSSGDTTLNANYVDTNGNTLQGLGFGSIPLNAVGIKVELTYNQPTTFLRAIGISAFQVPAEAMALTGPITQLPGNGNLLPIGVPDEAVQQIRDGEIITIFDDGRYCRDQAGTNCIDTGVNSAFRGWLNFNYVYNSRFLQSTSPYYRTITTSDAASSLSDYVTGAKRIPLFAGTINQLNEDFVKGYTGQTQGVMNSINQLYHGQVVYLPVFDKVYSGEFLAANASSFPPPEDGWPSSIWNKKNEFMYHIVGFTAIIPQSASSNGVTAIFKSATIGQGIINPSAVNTGQPCRILAYGITLWK